MNKMIFVRIIIIVLILIFFGGIALGANDLLSREGQLPVEPKPSLTEIDDSPEAILAYLNNCLHLAQTEKPKLEVSTEITIPEEDVRFSGADKDIQTVMLYAKDKIAAKLAEKIPKKTSDFGGDITALLQMPSLKQEQISEIKSSYINKPEDGTEEVTDVNSIAITVPGESVPLKGSGAIAQNFHPRTQEQIKELLGGELDSTCTISNVQKRYQDCVIKATANRFTDKIQTLEYIKRIEITATIQLTGDLKGAKPFTCAFVWIENTKSSFTWPQLSLNAETYSMEKGKTENLKATATPADPNNVITWQSSDESVATVDDEGYIKSHKFGKTIISVSFMFRGKTYTDECELDVKISVDGIKISKRELTLAAGEEFTFNAKVVPRGATIKTVKFYSENPSVAAITIDGRMTALSPGEAVIYAVSDDGLYKSSCQVTVMTVKGG